LDIGRILFRYRAFIGVAGFVLAFVFARPSAALMFWGLLPIVLGLALRVWAAGYLGEAGRTHSISVEEVVVSGPYRYIRNPLYIGNFLLVLGSLLALNPRWWLSAATLVLFVIEYTIISRAEQKARDSYFASRAPHLVSGVPSPSKGEGKGEGARGNSAFRIPHSAMPRHFSFSRARYEWITVALLALVYLLAVLRARLRF